MATKIQIGDKEYIVRELNFVAVKKSWNAILKTMIALDPIQAIAAALEVIGAALQEEPEFNREDFGIDKDAMLTAEEIDQAVCLFLEKKLKAGQIKNVQQGLDQIIEEAGLRPTEGELLTMENLGMETLVPLSPNLSQPDVKEEAGTQ